MEKRLITREAVRRVLKDYSLQYKAHPWQSITAFLLPAVGTIFIFFIPPLVVARLVDIFAIQGNVPLETAAWYVVAFGGFWLLGEAFWRIGMHILIKLETAGISALTNTAFNRLTERDYNFYTNNFVGSLTKRASAFARGFEVFTDTLSFNVLNNTFPIIFATVVLWQYSLFIPILLLSCIAIAVGVGIPIVRRRSRLVALRHDASSKVAGRISDSMTNIMAIKSFAREGWEQTAFGEYVEDYALKFKKAANYQNLRFDMFMSPLYVATNVIGLIAALILAKNFGLTAGVIVIVFSYYSHITKIFWDVSRIYRNIESAVSEAAEFTQLLIEPPEVQDIPGALLLRLRDKDISFKAVKFKYAGEQNGKEFSLKNFNLEIKGGERVGLVGPSGGGKTTITKLLLRFIDVESGKILIDNQDVSRVTQASLREAIAYVPQDPLLFHRSLFENISYGNDKATEKEVIEAAKLARADEFTDKLPNGYQTLVGERGIKLSGGQRQRIAIARAILKQSPILVLDEATSSLDSESEKYIQEGLWELMKGKTALVIAHRLSTIRHLDRIIVMEEGEIVQDGTHDELIAQKGLYARLWGHQSGGFLKN